MDGELTKKIIIIGRFCANLCMVVGGCEEIEHGVYFMQNHEEMNLIGDNVTV